MQRLRQAQGGVHVVEEREYQAQESTPGDQERNAQWRWNAA